MHRRLAVLLALVVLVVVPGAAHAKGLTELAICGATGCVDRSAEVRSDPSVVQELMSGGATVADPDPAPYLRLKEGMGDGAKTYGQNTVTYYPTLGIQRFEDGTFHRTTLGFQRELARLARGVRPWGVPARAPARAAVTRPRAGGDGDDGGGGIPTGAWLAGAAAAVLLAAGGVAMARRGRPATG